MNHETDLNRYRDLLITKPGPVGCTISTSSGGAGRSISGLDDALRNPACILKGSGRTANIRIGSGALAPLVDLLDGPPISRTKATRST